MATCRDIVTRAYQMTGIVPLGDDPTASEVAFGLGALQSMFDEWVANGMFGRLTDKLVTSDYTALEGQRVTVSGSATVTIPATYAANGCAGSDRAPYDLSLIEVVDGGTRNVWLYDRAEWVDLVGLELGDDCPLSGRGEHGLAAALAVSAMGPFATDVPLSVARSARAFLSQLSYKLGSQRPARTAEYF